MLYMRGVDYAQRHGANVVATLADVAMIFRHYFRRRYAVTLFACCC